MSLKLNVVVPTRRRARTLAATLATIKSAIEQGTDRTVVVGVAVLNNGADPETRAIVERADLPLRYTETTQDLAMRDSWEAALTLLDGDADYVLFVGDDDGLVPNAVELLGQILAERPAAVAWERLGYGWPDCSLIHMRDRLIVPRPWAEGRTEWRDAKATLSDLYAYRVSINDTPGIYHGIVARDLVERRRSSGRYFQGDIPDIESAVTTLWDCDRYLWSTRALTIGGASGSSVGVAYAVDDVCAAGCRAALGARVDPPMLVPGGG